MRYGHQTVAMPPWLRRGSGGPTLVESALVRAWLALESSASVSPPASRPVSNMASDDAAEIRDLFAEVIPEVANGKVEIKAIAREAGMRTKVAVFSRDLGVDCMAACVGERGIRIRTIVERTGGIERFDIVEWDESIERYIAKALHPAEVVFVRSDHLQRRAKVFVREDQVTLARGRRGQNRRLASELCGYEIEIVPLAETRER